MKKEYVTVAMWINRFDEADVLTTSGGSYFTTSDGDNCGTDLWD